MLFILIGVLGYAFLPIWTKLIQPSGLQPLDIAAWRFIFATPVIWILLFTLRTPAPNPPLSRKGLLGLGLLLAGAALSAFFGLERLPASTYVLLFYSYPAMVALINFALGERLPGKGWLALALTSVGIALTVPDFGAGLTANAWGGVLIAFVNALLVALYFIMNNRVLGNNRSAGWASAWAITGALAVMGLIILTRGLMLPPDAPTLLLLLALGLVSTVMPIFMVMNGIRQLGASRAAILSTVEPIGTFVLAALLLGETLQPVQILGGALILTSVILLQVSRRRPVAQVAPATGD